MAFHCIGSSGAHPVVHVVDDDHGVRRTLGRLLEGAGFTVSTYESGTAFIHASAALSNGCVLVDVWMPSMDGLELLAQLKDEHFALPVIMMTGRGDVLTAVHAMKGGAVDFLEKPFSDDLLVRTIETALAARNQDQHRKQIIDAAARVAALSPREIDVLNAVLTGRSNKTIAFDLCLSVRTVEVHRARMMERLGVRHVAEAVQLAVLARMAS